MDLSHLKGVPAKLVGVFGIVATLGACATPGPDAQPPRSTATAASSGSSCNYQGEFKVLLGVFYASVHGYNEKCGAGKAIITILETSQDPEERAFAIAYLAEEYPHIKRQLDEFADAVISGKDPLIHAVPAGTAVECTAARVISSGNGKTTFATSNCHGVIPSTTGPA